MASGLDPTQALRASAAAVRKRRATVRLRWASVVPPRDTEGGR
eukprot:CAMPEP_0176296098 /NCGR_PEP_ID=MMETSP0121_2-20121125/58019_1 /TAXON_ID=160619 /ORGANISM="Kryptoperidinium foliaceum, Strain CCMP 1326" /LENGTH=42 /DNA_ID= /DNA_START= /DNA_END= /DNA_ORIENTATION=